MHEASHNHVSRKFDGPPPRNHQCGSSVPRCRPEIAGPRGHGQRSAALEQEQRNHRKPRPPRPRVCTTVQVRTVPRPRLALPQASIRSPVVVAVSFCKVFSTLRSSEPSTFTLAISARARCTESVAWARARKDMGRSAAVRTVWQHVARQPGTKLTMRRWARVGRAPARRATRRCRMRVGAKISGAGCATVARRPADQSVRKKRNERAKENKRTWQKVYGRKRVEGICFTLLAGLGLL